MRTRIIVFAAALGRERRDQFGRSGTVRQHAHRRREEQGWVLLFNGKTFDGWRQCNGTAMPANWTIEDQAMKVFTAEGKKPGQGSGGDVLYGVKKFRNFELSID